MPGHAVFTRRTYDLGAEEWVEIVAPIDCDHVLTRHVAGQVLLMRDCDGAAESEDDLQPGLQDVIAAPFVPGSLRRVWNGREYRFLQGETVARYKAASGSCRVRVTFIR